MTSNVNLELSSRHAGNDMVDIYRFAEILTDSIRLITDIKWGPSFRDTIKFIHLFNGVFWSLDVISTGGTKVTYIHIDISLLDIYLKSNGYLRNI